LVILTFPTFQRMPRLASCATPLFLSQDAGCFAAAQWIMSRPSCVENSDKPSLEFWICQKSLFRLKKLPF
jgi:hypothetical protein